MSPSLKPWLALSAGLHLALVLGAMLWLRRESHEADETIEHIRQAVEEREMAAVQAAEEAWRQSTLEHARAQFEAALDQVLNLQDQSPVPESLRKQFEVRLEDFWSQADTHRLLGPEATEALREMREEWLTKMNELSQELREQTMERMLADVLQEQVLPRIQQALENALRNQVAGELNNRVMQTVREDARGGADERRTHEQQKQLQREIVERALAGIQTSAAKSLDQALQQCLAQAVSRLAESARNELNRSGQQGQLSAYVEQHLADAVKRMLEEIRPDAALATSRLRSANGLPDTAMISLADGAHAIAVARAQSAGDEALQSQMGQAVQRGLEAARFNGMLNGASRTGELQGVLSLAERIAQAQGDLARHGDEGGDVLDLGIMLAGGPPPNNATAGFEHDPASRMALAGNQARVRFNREVYEAYLSRMQGRDQAADNAQTNTPLLAVSEASHKATSVVATIFVPEFKTEKTLVESKRERSIPEPEFEHVAFGAAPRLTNSLTVDGDLSDWGDLTQPMTMRYAASSATPIANGPVVFLRWAADGLYLAARVQDAGGIQPCPQQVFQGDGLEVWLDTLNSRRKLMSDTPSSHQLFFTPFGYRGNANSTFAEWGRGARGLRMDVTYPDDKRERGWSAARLTSDGYTVEAFLKRSALAVPRLEAGRYLAMNFSVNLDGAQQFQWSASKAIGTWDKPFTWGDVLLLGTDATVTAEPLHSVTAAARTAIAPGEVLRVTVADADMNLDAAERERVLVRAAVAGSMESVLLVLAETGPDTGVFTGSFDTQPLYEPAQRNSVRVRGGDVVEIAYQDAHPSDGECNQTIVTQVKVGWPVMQLARE